MNILKYIFFSILLSFLFLVPNALAAAFTASVIPSSLDAGSVATLNFTINNNDAINITQVIITLPTGFSYNGNTGTTVSPSIVTFSGTIWSNTTSVGIVQSGTTQYFWFDVITPSMTGNYNFNITTFDINGVYTSTNLQVTVTDLTPPRWLAGSNTTQPSTGANYSSGRLYQFNISWSDNVALSRVLIEHNFTGVLSNFTVFNVSGSTYYYFFSDIGAGNYVYRWYANDTSNNFNSTPQFIYEVTKAANPVNIYINGNLNQNVIIFNGTTVNVTAVGLGIITIYQNNTQVASGINTISYMPSPTLGIGFYTFRANLTSNNANYTDNSTGVAYNLTIIHPAPRWISNITSIPTTYSNTTFSTFNITWNDMNDVNAFNFSILEANFTGSVVNYTMYRLPSTNTSSFQIILPAGTFYWKVYANNSYGSFNSTPQFFITVQKATPTINLLAFPNWNNLPNTQTNVSCTSPISEIILRLYRNNVLVNNPDVQNFGEGEFNYVCNNTATQNYTSNSVSSILRISESVINLTIIADQIITIEQDSVNSTLVIIRNTGDITQNVNFSLEGIEPSWYSLNATNKTVLPGHSFPVLVTFNVGKFEIKDYSGIFRAFGENKTISLNFKLRILPGPENKTYINNTFLTYKAELIKLEDDINKTKEKGVDTTLIEANYTVLKQKINEIESSINSADYFSAYQKLPEVKGLLEALRSSLNVQQQFSLPPISQFKGFPIYYLLAAIPVLGLLIYLFWPTKGYVPEKYKGFGKFNLNSISDFFKKIKEKLKEIFKRRPKYKQGQSEVELGFKSVENQKI